MSVITYICSATHLQCCLIQILSLYPPNLPSDYASPAVQEKKSHIGLLLDIVHQRIKSEALPRPNRAFIEVMKSQATVLAHSVHGTLSAALILKDPSFEAMSGGDAIFGRAPGVGPE